MLRKIKMLILFIIHIFIHLIAIAIFTNPADNFFNLKFLYLWWSIWPSLILFSYMLKDDASIRESVELLNFTEIIILSLFVAFPFFLFTQGFIFAVKYLVLVFVFSILVVHIPPIRDSFGIVDRLILFFFFIPIYFCFILFDLLGCRLVFDILYLILGF